MSSDSFASGLGCLLLAGTTFAAQPPSVAIESEAQRFLNQAFAPQLQTGDTLKIQFNRMDNRLQITACAEPIQFNTPRPLQAGSFQLIARCNHPRRWQLRIGGKAEIYRSLWLSRTPLSRGTPLTPEMLVRQTFPLSQLHSPPLSDPIPWYGYTLKQNIPAGHPLAIDHLEAPIVIQKGDAVVIRAGSGAVRVEAPGIALEAGRLQEQISVENARSNRALRARVAGPGRVEIP